MTRRARKKHQTAQKIAAAALRLFAKRGFEAVTVTEVAEAADVARGTLFSYFPTKESLVLAAVGDDDPAQIVAEREPGLSPFEALRDYYRSFASDPSVDAHPDLLATLRVITNSATLSAAVNRLYDAQRDRLAEVLGKEAGRGHNGLIAKVAAAQICATILAVKGDFFGRLSAGEDIARAVKELPASVECAFRLLEHGIGPAGRKRPGRKRT